eukprot:TRINITY_DN206_c0_g3_i1.p1 TRINITY_DN206_c0_g3~~TRINITY_DN206_c0_g3_i1.p1  ORF type:complete len:167 (-),score=26.82 TRINITY_DN206_c0_g3_i1:217-690(-)
MHVFAASFGGASVWEKRKANEVVDKLQKERPKCEDHTIDSFDEDSDQAKMFWEIVGEKPESLPAAYAGDEEEKKEDEGIKVFKVHDCGAKGAKTEITELEFELVDGNCQRVCFRTTTRILLPLSPAVSCTCGSARVRPKRRKPPPFRCCPMNERTLP